MRGVWGVPRGRVHVELSDEAGAGNRTEEAYGRRITGKGRSYAERQRERVACGECGEFLAVGFMSSYLMRRGPETGQRRPTVGGSQGRGGPTRRDNGRG